MPPPLLSPRDVIMWSTRLYTLLDATPLGRLIEHQAEIASRTDPDRIYAADIQQFFHIPHALARAACNLAVRYGVFQKCLDAANQPCYKLAPDDTA